MSLSDEARELLGQTTPGAQPSAEGAPPEGQPSPEEQVQQAQQEREEFEKAQSDALREAKERLETEGRPRPVGGGKWYHHKAFDAVKEALEAERATVRAYEDQGFFKL